MAPPTSPPSPEAIAAFDRYVKISFPRGVKPDSLKILRRTFLAGWSAKGRSRKRAHQQNQRERAATAAPSFGE